ncbi:MAG: hypothetical protein ACT452_13145, partial [Microthrixaceae bacterium]
GGSDYDAVSGAGVIAPLETSFTVRVTVHGDVRGEHDEDMFLDLTGVSNAVFGRSRGVGTIVTDDALLTLVPIGVPA